MRLYAPSERVTNILLTVGFCAVGYALYLRYMVVENSTVGLGCTAGLATWLCATRQLVITVFTNSVFGWTALAVATLNLVRPSHVLFAFALAAAAMGLVLYNAALSGLAVSLLIFSLARRAPEPE